MSRALAPALVLLTAALVAGCGGDDAEEAAARAQPQRAAAARPGTADAAPGRVLLAFVRAAGRGDAEAMWGLLSKATRASIGPTLGGFRRGAAVELARGLGPLAPTARPILSRALTNGWAVAAVAGERPLNGRRRYVAYGAALRRERGRLALELEGAVVTSLRPEPLEATHEVLPELGATVAAGGDVTDVRVWLDGKAARVARDRERPFTATVRGRPGRALGPGRHAIVVFASAEHTAVASAWTFTVAG